MGIRARPVAWLVVLIIFSSTNQLLKSGRKMPSQMDVALWCYSTSGLGVDGWMDGWDDSVG